MKRIVSILFAVCMLLTLTFSAMISEAGEVTTGLCDFGEPKGLSGSFVVFDPSAGGETGYTAGVANDLVFRAETFTADWEYVYDLWLQFPADWVVNSVSVVGTPICDSGAGWGTLTYTVQTPANTVDILHARYQSGTDHCTAYYMVNVTPGSNIGDAYVSWYYDGDGYGGTPHWPCSDDGYTPPGLLPCDEMVNPQAVVPPFVFVPNIYITPEDQDVVDCPGVSTDFVFNLENDTGTDGTISLSYLITSGYGTVTGPDQIYLGTGVDQDFAVTLTSAGWLAEGEIVTASIEAEFGVYTDSASVSQEIAWGGGWYDIATEPDSGRQDNSLAVYNGLIWSIAGYGTENSVKYYDPDTDTWTTVPDSVFQTNYARSCGVYGNKAYIYGDATSGFAGLWSYNMDTNVWANESPSGTAPALTGIWAPSWVADPDTGYLYMTGGATIPGGGNLAAVYVYDPAGNAWLAPLPDFTTARDFHAAYIYTDPVSGHKMLAVAGGVESSGNELSSTQCYDFTTGVWNAENADLPALPVTWWGMGYAHNVFAGEHELWIVAGASGGMIYNESVYYDFNAGTWVSAGAPHVTEAYRLSAAALDGVVYKISGNNAAGTCSKFLRCDVAQSPDAGITAGDISFLPGAPLPGDIVDVTARVHNMGDAPITGGNANFYYSLQPGVDLQLIDTVAFTDILPGEYTDVMINWATDAAMDPRIYIITVEITDVLPTDVDLTNNTAEIEIPLPVELGYFTAQGMGNTVNIQWETVTETDNLGFNLYRISGNKISPFVTPSPVKLNDSLIAGQGTSSEPKAYSFTDHVKNGGKYIYILECISTEGIATDEYKTRLQWLF